MLVKKVFFHYIFVGEEVFSFWYKWLPTVTQMIFLQNLGPPTKITAGFPIPALALGQTEGKGRGQTEALSWVRLRPWSRGRLRPWPIGLTEALALGQMNPWARIYHGSMVETIKNP